MTVRRVRYGSGSRGGATDLDGSARLGSDPNPKYPLHLSLSPSLSLASLLCRSGFSPWTKMEEGMGIEEGKSHRSANWAQGERGSLLFALGEDEGSRRYWGVANWAWVAGLRAMVWAPLDFFWFEEDEQTLQ